MAIKKSNKKAALSCDKEERAIFSDKELTRLLTEDSRNNTNLSIDYVNKCIENGSMDEEDDWDWVGYKTKLPDEFIETFKDKLDWYYVCSNIDISLEWCEKYKDKVDWVELFDKNKDFFTFEVLKKFEDSIDVKMMADENETIEFDCFLEYTNEKKLNSTKKKLELEKTKKILSLFNLPVASYLEQIEQSKIKKLFSPVVFNEESGFTVTLNHLVNFYNRKYLRLSTEINNTNKVNQSVGVIIFITNTDRNPIEDIEVIVGTESFVNNKINELLIEHVKNSYDLTDKEIKKLEKDPENFYHEFDHIGYDVLIQRPEDSFRIIREK